MRTVTAATLAAVLLLAGCGSDPAPQDTASAEEAFIAQVREAAPWDTETDLELLTNAQGVCDHFDSSDDVAEHAEWLVVIDGGEQRQHEFNVAYVDGATRYLCPEHHDLYLMARDLADDGNFGDKPAAEPTLTEVRAACRAKAEPQVADGSTFEESPSAIETTFQGDPTWLIYGTWTQPDGVKFFQDCVAVWHGAELGADAEVSVLD